MKKIIFFSLFLLLSSCAATGPKFTKLEVIQDDKALVYILRPSAPTVSTRKVNISINDELYVKLFNKGYTIARLHPGVYEFKQSANNFPGDAIEFQKIREFKMEIKGGETYFIGFHADSDIEKIHPWYVPWFSSSVTFKFGFGVIEKEQALELLKKCHYQEPE